MHSWNLIGQVLWNIQHLNMTFTTWQNLLLCNHYCHSGVERGVWLAMCCFFGMLLKDRRLERRYSKSAINVWAYLFERHLKIDPVWLFKSEGANQSAKHLLANMRHGTSDIAMTCKSFTCNQERIQALGQVWTVTVVFFFNTQVTGLRRVHCFCLQTVGYQGLLLPLEW